MTSSSRSSLPEHYVETGDDFIDSYQLRTFFADPFVEHHSRISDVSRGIRNRLEIKQWRRVRQIGRGGFGIVYLETERGGAVRAVKEIPKYTHKTRTIDHLREILAMAHFSAKDSFFIKLHGWFQNQDSIFIAMEYALHGDLEECVKENLPEPEVQTITLQLVEALTFMHQKNFTHRDLKPSNVFVVSKAPVWWVKLGDFGVSKRVRGNSTSMHTSIDTEYSAPEILGFIGDGSEEYSKYTNTVDMWSLGCLVHWLLAQLLPLKRWELMPFCLGSRPFPTQYLSKQLVSLEGIDFVQKLVIPQPHGRMNASEALKHDWIREGFDVNGILVQHSSSDAQVNRAITKRWAEAKQINYEGNFWSDDDDDYYESTLSSARGGQKSDLPAQNASAQRYGALAPHQGITQSSRSFTNPSPTRSNDRPSFDRGDDWRNFSSHAPSSSFGGPYPSTQRNPFPEPQHDWQQPYHEPLTRAFNGLLPLRIQTQARPQSRDHPPPTRPSSRDLAQSTRLASTLNTRGGPYQDPAGGFTYGTAEAGAGGQSESSGRPSLSDLQGRSESPYKAMNPPMSARSQNSRDESPAKRFPPRKSSLGQDTLILEPSLQSVSSDSAGNAIPASDTTEGPKPLPFIRPADLYKRMAEEREKERRKESGEILDADGEPLGKLEAGDPADLEGLEIGDNGKNLDEADSPLAQLPNTHSHGVQILSNKDNSNNRNKARNTSRPSQNGSNHAGIGPNNSSTGTFVFRWPHIASDVYVTGTFDDWSKTEKLEKVGDVFEKEVTLPSADEKYYYKFVVDDYWIIDHEAPREDDGHYHVNNILMPKQIKRKTML